MSLRKRVAYLSLSWLPHAVAYVGVPNVIAAAGVRVGLSVGVGYWSAAGVPFAIVGALAIALAIAGHYRASPDELQMTARPSYLSTTGAYAISRNPLYLGGAFLWVGWAIAWLSVAVVGIGVLLFGFLALVGVPYEEQLLRAQHGQNYDAYCDSVPRWLHLRPARWRRASGIHRS